MSPAPLPPSQRGWRFDAKMIASLVALVTALSGAVELRVKVGLMSDRLDRVEKILLEEHRYARTD